MKSNYNFLECRFEQTVQEATIREDSLPGTVVATVVATDVDAHSKLDYFILSGDPHNQFAVSSDGKVYTRLLIDREARASYELELGAFDGKHRDEMRLRVRVLDVSDQRPMCGAETTVVSLDLEENTEMGAFVYAVRAETSERNVTRLRYEIIGREQVETGADNLLETYLEPELPFGVDETSGVVRVTDQIDYEHKRAYEFYVRVCKTDVESSSDVSSVSRANSLVLLSWSQYCLVKIKVNVLDLNDNAPEFETTHTTRRVIDVIEGSRRGTILAQLVANDPDARANSVVRYEMIESTAVSLFSLQPRSGIVQLADTAELDREQLARVNFTVRAYNPLDHLSTDYSVEVNVVDLNDNPPRFERAEYYISVEENLPAGFLLTQLTAHDPDLNSTTEYSIVADDG